MFRMFNQNFFIFNIFFFALLCTYFIFKKIIHSVAIKVLFIIPNQENIFSLQNTKIQFSGVNHRIVHKIAKNCTPAHHSSFPPPSSPFSCFFLAFVFPSPIQPQERVKAPTGSIKWPSKCNFGQINFIVNADFIQIIPQFSERIN